MNKILSILIVLIITITGIVVLNNPTIHKQLMIVDSSYSFVEETVQPKIKYPPKLQNEQKKETKIVIKNEIKTTPQPTKTNKKTEIKSQNTPKQQKITEIKKESPLETKEKNKEIKTQDIIGQQQSTEAEKKPPQVTEIKELTEEEEIIAWNKWRSDLQNQVMKDTTISAPLGVAFKFSFTVDKFGNLSNVKVWSTTTQYSDMAVKTIKPVLMGYQGKEILNFPQGTKRIITNVAGGFVMSTSTGYSSPSDYSDYERIRK